MIMEYRFHWSHGNIDFILSADSEERNRQFIKVEIKPLSPNDSANGGGGGGGNVEDIMKSIEGLKLSPTATVSENNVSYGLCNLK
jgi:hypothetical protein